MDARVSRRDLVAAAAGLVAVVVASGAEFPAGEPGAVGGLASADGSASRRFRYGIAAEMPTNGFGSVTLDSLLVEVFQFVNEARRAAGVGVLALHPLLIQAAQAHADDLADRNVLEHAGPNGESAGDRIFGVGYPAVWWSENGAVGFRAPRQTVDAWLDSEKHRGNMLDPRVDEIGLGIAYTRLGVPYWVLKFGSRG